MGKANIADANDAAPHPVKAKCYYFQNNEIISIKQSGIKKEME